MALISKISYKVSGDYYKPKSVARKSPPPAPKPVINNKYTSGQVGIPGMAGWKVPQAVATPPVYIPPPAPVARNPIINPYTTGQAPIPGMAGYKVPAQEKGVGFKPTKMQQLSVWMDKLFGSNAKSSLGAASKGAIPIKAYNQFPSNVPVPIAPAPAPRYSGWNSMPYNVQQAQQPRPAAPYSGWNPMPYNVQKSTPPVPDAILASPWQSQNVGRKPGQPTDAQRNIQILQDRYNATGSYNPYGGKLDAQLAPAYNSDRYNYENWGSPQMQAGVAPTGAVEDRFSRGNFLREMTYNTRPKPTSPRGYFDFNSMGAFPNQMLSFAKDYPWETSQGWYAPPLDWKDTTQQWKESFDNGWQVNPMVDNSSYEPYVEGGAGGWGYGGGGYGGGGGSSHYNSNPNYIGSNRGYNQTHRQSMLLWNI
jgi:hypothetical protein